MQRLESSRAMGQLSRVHDNSSFILPDTDEVMSAISKMAKVADEAMLQKGSGASQKRKCGYGMWPQNDAARPPCYEERLAMKNGSWEELKERY